MYRNAQIDVLDLDLNVVSSWNRMATCLLQSLPRKSIFTSSCFSL